MRKKNKIKVHNQEYTAEDHNNILSIKLKLNSNKKRM